MYICWVAYIGLICMIQTDHVSAAGVAAAAPAGPGSATGRSPAACRAPSPPTPYNIATLTRIATGRGRARSSGRDGSGLRCGRCLGPAPPPPCDTRSVLLAAPTPSKLPLRTSPHTHTSQQYMNNIQILCKTHDQDKVYS